ncbi:MAG: NUDIX domain-containing protein [Planctomycetota bacterium]
MKPDSDFREPHLRHGDFLGSFGVLETARGILMVENERRIGGREVRVFDLPGGQVEPGELLLEALRRELREEIGVEVTGEPEFLFVQEGEKVEAGARRYAWRSFFFAVRSWHGEPRAQGEIFSVRSVPRDEVPALLVAPYHDSFRQWLERGGRCFSSQWRE